MGLPPHGRHRAGRARPSRLRCACFVISSFAAFFLVSVAALVASAPTASTDGVGRALRARHALADRAHAAAHAVRGSKSAVALSSAASRLLARRRGEAPQPAAAAFRAHTTTGAPAEQPVGSERAPPAAKRAPAGGPAHAPTGHPTLEPSSPVCVDVHANCATWRAGGECASNPGFMRVSCTKSCDACGDLLKKQETCHRTLAKAPLLRRGGVDGTFETLLQRMAAEGRAVEVLSRPPRGPWVVTIDDFLADHEVRAMVEKGGHHFERSLAGSGVTNVRTSQTSWCNVPFCEKDPVVHGVKLRVANATGVPLANSEHVQVLRYEVGDFYKQHHDQNAHPRSPWGARLFTFFLYLSDVDGGGGTRFTNLNLTVQAKRGRALMWPSVFDDDPSAVRSTSDDRTTHEALTVTRGQKLAANMWLHQYDFQSALALGCANSDHAACGDCDGEAAAELPARGAAAGRAAGLRGAGHH